MRGELGETVKRMAHNLWRDLPLVLSGASCLCLFLKNDPIHWLLLGGIFFLLAAAAAMGMIDRKEQSGWVKAAALILGALLDCYGFTVFTTVWAGSKRAGIIASVLGLSRETVLCIIGGVGCILGFYALYTLFLIVVRAFRELLEDHCTVRTVPEIGRRLLVNLPLPVSAYVFLTVAGAFPRGIQGALVLLLYCGVASQLPPIWTTIRKAGLPLNIFSAVSALGIFCGRDFLVYNNWTAVFDELPLWARFRPLRYAAAAAFCFFLFVSILIFWRMLTKTLFGGGGYFET